MLNAITLCNMKNRLSYFTVVAILLLYAFGANNNSSIDAWSYAADIQNGDHLLQPHHLLYDVMGYLWVQVMGSFLPFAAIELLKLMNALFATVALFVLSQILGELGVGARRIFYLLIFVGASWGVMRYATENEAYIVPIVFSLLGSLYFIRAICRNSARLLLISGFFAAIATLFHQVMFFWWVALLIGVAYQGRLKNFLLFVMPALVVPIVYSIAVYAEVGELGVSPFVSYVFSDYFSGAAGVVFGKKSLLLLVISTFRTFFQVHGYVGILCVQSIWWCVLAGLVAMLVVAATVFFVWHLPRLGRVDVVFGVHLLAVLLQLLFAALSDGNAEFLVMLPFLCAILFTYWHGYSVKGVAPLLLAMLLWNVGFGVIPLKTRTIDGSSMVVRHIMDWGNPCSVYIVHDRPRIENELNCRGCSNGTLLFKPCEVSAFAIDTMLANGYDVYTDIPNRPKTYSREVFVGVKYNVQELLNGYRLTPIGRQKSLNGIFWFYRVIR